VSINNLYVSHKTYDWYANNQSGEFLNQKNIKNIVNDKSAYDCFTTPEDISVENLSLLLTSKHIHLLDFNEHTLDQLGESAYVYFVFFQKVLSRPEFKNLAWVNKLKVNLQFLQQSRNSTDNLLWAAGCSITYGYGINKKERFTSVLAKRLKRTEISLAESGSSIAWSADQILRSDIKKDDIVVWGLTNFARLDVAENFNLHSCTVMRYDLVDKKQKYWNADYFYSTTLATICLRQILQVINFCDKIGARLYIANLLDVHAPLFLNNDQKFIDLLPEFNYLEDRWKYLDYASDNQHPGKAHHKFYAEELYKFITQYEIDRPHY
jgi:hypothetical protein